jgi:hypothetical protein
MYVEREVWEVWFSAIRTTPQVLRPGRSGLVNLLMKEKKEVGTSKEIVNFSRSLGWHQHFLSVICAGHNFALITQKSLVTILWWFSMASPQWTFLSYCDNFWGIRNELSLLLRSSTHSWFLVLVRRRRDFSVFINCERQLVPAYGVLASVLFVWLALFLAEFNT